MNNIPPTTTNESVLTNREEERNNLEEQGPIVYVWRKLVQEWKATPDEPNRPWKTLGIFLFWMLLTYAIFSYLGGVNFTLLYCESDAAQIHGYYFDTMDAWATYANARVYNCLGESGLQYTDYKTKMLLKKAAEDPSQKGMVYSCAIAPEFSCHYNASAYNTPTGFTLLPLASIPTHLWGI